MNRQEADILCLLHHKEYGSQRELAAAAGYSVGIVNRSLRTLREEGYLDAKQRPTAKAEAAFREKAPRSAVILAAGAGLRMAPIGMETPKALLEIKGEVLIERLIRQLRSEADQFVFLGNYEEIR